MKDKFNQNSKGEPDEHYCRLERLLFYFKILWVAPNFLEALVRPLLQKVYQESNSFCFNEIHKTNSLKFCYSGRKMGSQIYV